MILPFVPPFILLIARRSLERFIRCSYFIVDQLHVHLDHGCVIGEAPPDHSKHGKPADSAPPPFVDVFENPCFVSTDYKDDRAAVNIANTASHAGTQAHPKNCPCKPCRDRRPAFPKAVKRRRHGYRGSQRHKRTAALDLGALAQSDTIPEMESRKSVANLHAGKSSPGPLPLQSKLRRGDHRSLNSGTNRFASLPIERTEDEDNDRLHAEHRPVYHSTKASNDCSAGIVEEASANFAQGLAVGLSLAQIAALLENEVDSDLEDDDLDSNDPEQSSTSCRLSVPTHTRSVEPYSYTAGPQGQPRSPNQISKLGTSLSETTIKGGSRTTEDAGR